MFRIAARFRMKADFQSRLRFPITHPRFPPPIPRNGHRSSALSPSHKQISCQTRPRRVNYLQPLRNALGITGLRIPVTLISLVQPHRTGTALRIMDMIPALQRIDPLLLVVRQYVTTWCAKST